MGHGDTVAVIYLESDDSSHSFCIPNLNDYLNTVALEVVAASGMVMINQYDSSWWPWSESVLVQGDG